MTLCRDSHLKSKNKEKWGSYHKNKTGYFKGKTGECDQGKGASSMPPIFHISTWAVVRWEFAWSLFLKTIQKCLMHCCFCNSNHFLKEKKKKTREQSSLPFKTRFFCFVFLATWKCYKSWQAVAYQDHTHTKRVNKYATVKIQTRYSTPVTSSPSVHRRWYLVMYITPIINMYSSCFLSPRMFGKYALVQYSTYHLGACDTNFKQCPLVNP